MNHKAKQLSTRRHALVSHFKDGEIKMAYVPYYNDHGWGTVLDKVTCACFDMGFKSPVCLVQSGSGESINEDLY